MRTYRTPLSWTTWATSPRLTADIGVRPGGRPPAKAGCREGRPATNRGGGRGSAGDEELVKNIEDAGSHPGRNDHGVVLGPGSNVTNESHSVAVGLNQDVAVVSDERVAQQCVLDIQRHIHRIRVIDDVDLVFDAAHPDQPGNGISGRHALATERDR